MRAPYTDAPGHALPHLFAMAAGDRPTVAAISLKALAHNFDEVVRRAGGRGIVAVVKAGAYGHGLVAVSRHLLGCGATMLGVALIEEGRELRTAGIDAPILVMGPVFPWQADAIVEWRLTPTVAGLAFASALDAAANKRGGQVSVHVKIDTGMGRIGIRPEDAAEFIQQLKKHNHLTVDGLMTHFADADLKDKAFADGQMKRFEALLNALEARGIAIPLRHAANSAAILDYGRALFTMVRPGLMLYGYDPLQEGDLKSDLKPVLSLVTRIVFLKSVPSGTPISYGRTFVTARESLIATIPIGYADGYSRGLSNQGEALVRSKRVPIAGRVCMDMAMLDVTDVPGVQEGDEVVLIGSSEGETITANDIAKMTGTIAYEVLCGISSRVPRVYV